ncbi:MAG: DsrE family protein [Acidimicrobiia bacterium]
MRTSSDAVGCLSSDREVATSSILFTATHGSDDPTKATIPFIGAVGALEAGHEPRIALLGEGAYLALESVVDAIHGIGFPPLSAFFSRIIEDGVPVYV